LSIDPRESEKRVTAIFPPHTLLYLSRLDEQLKGLTPNNQASTKREMEISGGEDRESGPPQWMWMCNTSWCQQRRYVDIEPIITQTAWRHVMESRSVGMTYGWTIMSALSAPVLAVERQRPFLINRCRHVTNCWPQQSPRPPYPQVRIYGTIMRHFFILTDPSSP